MACGEHISEAFNFAPFEMKSKAENSGRKEGFSTCCFSEKYFYQPVPRKLGKNNLGYFETYCSWPTDILPSRYCVWSNLSTERQAVGLFFTKHHFGRLSICIFSGCTQKTSRLKIPRAENSQLLKYLSFSVERYFQPRYIFSREIFPAARYFQARCSCVHSLSQAHQSGSSYSPGERIGISYKPLSVHLRRRCRHWRLFRTFLPKQIQCNRYCW